MLWHDILVWITGKINDAATAMTPYTLALGDGTDAHPGFDGSSFHYIMVYIVQLDKFLPVHDGVVPIFLLVTGWSTALMALRVAKFILDLIP